MRITFLIIILGAVLWFAITNADSVLLKLLFWDVNVSLALVVGAALLLGFLLGVLYLTPNLLRQSKTARTSTKELSKTQKERDELNERSQVLKEQVEQLAPRTKSDNSD